MPFLGEALKTSPPRATFTYGIFSTFAIDFFFGVHIANPEKRRPCLFLLTLLGMSKANVH